MKRMLKPAGIALLVCLGPVAVVILPTVAIRGTLWVSNRLLPSVNVAADVACLMALLVFVPLAIFKATRVLAAGGLLIASAVFGACLWMTSVVLTYAQWGTFGLLVGLGFLGIGVAPLALLASTINAAWAMCGRLVWLTIGAVGSHGVAVYLLQREDTAQRQPTVGNWQGAEDAVRRQVHDVRTQGEGRRVDRVAADARRRFRAAVTRMNDAELEAIIIDLRRIASSDPRKLCRSRSTSP